VPVYRDGLGGRGRHVQDDRQAEGGREGVLGEHDPGLVRADCTGHQAHPRPQDTAQGLEDAEHIPERQGRGQDG